MRQIILDTETTGLNPQEGHRIIEIGCLEMVDRRLTGNHFHRYINPEREIEAGAMRVHGISNEFLAEKPLFADIVDELIEFIKGAELIIHNADFDVGFLNHEFALVSKRYKKVKQYCGVIDTLKIARQQHPGQRNSLDALCKRYGVDNSGRELHGALLDSELLADVYLLLTGGQVSLFSESNQQRHQTNASHSIKRVENNRQPLPIIYASKEELAAHAAMIQPIED